MYSGMRHWDTGDPVGNIFSGEALGPVVQAGSVTGGIHFHQYSSGPAVPKQLGAPPAHFTNRQNELTELDRAWALHGDRSGLVVLSGLGGVGKTAAALQWLHKNREQFTDGLFYADLTGGHAGHARPEDPSVVLGGWLRALGVTADELPVGLGQRAVWWRSLAADKAIAILLENPWTAAQVRALLPASARSMVVVTTRRRLAALLADGARFVDVAPMEAEDSTRLLEQTIGNERVAVESAEAMELAELCGGLPIALAVTAARLAVRPRSTLKAVAAQLRHERRRLQVLSRGEEASVRSAFDVSYSELPPEARRVYRAFGMHPGPEFGLAAAAAAAGLPHSDVEETIETLLDAHLLDEVAADRYRFHDLLWLHAREKADTEESREQRTAVVLRIVECYLRFAQASCRILTPHLRGANYSYTNPELTEPDFPEPAMALTWLEDERGNLVAAVDAAVEYGCFAAAWQLAYWMWPLFRYGGHHNDRLSVDRQAVRAAQELGNVEWEARATRRLALLHHLRGAYAESDDLLARCAELFTALDDKYGIADAKDAQAVVALARGDSALAVRYGEQARAAFLEQGHHRKAALALLVVGQAKVSVGDIADGIDVLRVARENLMSSSGVDPFNSARAGIVLGEALIQAGRLAEAEPFLDEGLAAMEELRSVAGRALAHRGHGALAVARGDVATAREHFTTAVRLFEHQGDSAADTVRASLSNLGHGPTNPG